MDISAAPAGRYFLRVAGVGRSEAFDIGHAGLGEADDAEIRSYPFLRRWGNVEGQTVAASEFTVWETVAPAAAVTGYLMQPGLSPAIDLREPAADIRDLPGYWALP